MLEQVRQALLPFLFTIEYPAILARLHNSPPLWLTLLTFSHSHFCIRRSSRVEQDSLPPSLKRRKLSLTVVPPPTEVILFNSLTLNWIQFGSEEKCGMGDVGSEGLIWVGRASGTTANWSNEESSLPRAAHFALDAVFLCVFFHYFIWHDYESFRRLLHIFVLMIFSVTTRWPWWVRSWWDAKALWGRGHEPQGLLTCYLLSNSLNEHLLPILHIFIL